MSDDTLPADQEPRHPIRVVSERTGLTPDVLRAWEKRYAAVAPPRREGARQRLYSDADVERLRLLRRVTQAGRSIGQVALLSDEELARLAREDEASRAAVPLAPVRADGTAASAFLSRAYEHVREHESTGLEQVFRRALVVLGADGFIDEVATPFLRRVGHGWMQGNVSVAQEHLSSAVLRRVLEVVAEAAAASDSPDAVVVATPAGQVHELGAMLAAASAAAAGWRVVYLGADLPAVEIARTAAKTGARAVALSIVIPREGDHTAAELRALRRELAPEVALIAGGEGASALSAAMDDAGILFLPDFAEFRRALVRLAHRGNGRAH